MNIPHHIQSTLLTLTRFSLPLSLYLIIIFICHSQPTAHPLMYWLYNLHANSIKLVVHLCLSRKSPFLDSARFCLSTQDCKLQGQRLRVDSRLRLVSGHPGPSCRARRPVHVTIKLPRHASYSGPASSRSLVLQACLELALLLTITSSLLDRSFAVSVLIARLLLVDR